MSSDHLEHTTAHYTVGTLTGHFAIVFGRVKAHAAHRDRACFSVILALALLLSVYIFVLGAGEAPARRRCGGRPFWHLRRD